MDFENKEFVEDIDLDIVDNLVKESVDYKD